MHQCGGGGASQSHQHCVHPLTACLEATVAQTAVAAVADTAGATTTMPYAKAGIKKQVYYPFQSFIIICWGSGNDMTQLIYECCCVVLGTVIRESATAAAVAAEPGCPIPWISRHNRFVYFLSSRFASNIENTETVFLFLLPSFGELKKLSLILVTLEMKFLGFFFGEFKLYWGFFFTFDFNVGGTAAAAAADCRL